MDPRVASVARRATEIRRQIWATLPFGYRLGKVFEALGSPYAQEWGRAIGALLQRSGVTGMPDPGPSWDPSRPDPRRLPRGYLVTEAGKIYSLVLRIMLNPADTQDVLQDVLLKLYSDNRIQSVPLPKAISYITTTAIMHAKSKARDRRRKPGRLPVDLEGEERDLEDTAFMTNPHFVEDPRAYRQIEELFGNGVWENKVVPVLERIHPDMPLFFNTLLDNPSQGIRAVVEQLPHFDQTYQTWLNILRHKVGPALKALADAA